MSPRQVALVMELAEGNLADVVHPHGGGRPPPNMVQVLQVMHVISPVACSTWYSWNKAPICGIFILNSLTTVLHVLDTYNMLLLPPACSPTLSFFESL